MLKRTDFLDSYSNFVDIIISRAKKKGEGEEREEMALRTFQNILAERMQTGQVLNV